MESTYNILSNKINDEYFNLHFTTGKIIDAKKLGNYYYFLITKHEVNYGEIINNYILIQYDILLQEYSFIDITQKCLIRVYLYNGIILNNYHYGKVCDIDNNILTSCNIQDKIIKSVDIFSNDFDYRTHNILYDKYLYYLYYNKNPYYPILFKNNQIIHYFDYHEDFQVFELKTWQEYIIVSGIVNTDKISGRKNI